MKAAELLVKCLENEGVKTLYGLPGEENLDIMDALLDSTIEFVTVRHEQGAAFMADVYGRLTGKAGVCLSTLGPGATNLITGVADADMDHAPVVALAGQAATTRLHKESHQVLDLVRLFEPVTKYSAEVREPEIVPEVIRKAFKVAQTERPGVCFVELPENIMEMNVEGRQPLKVQSPFTPHPAPEKIRQAAEIISQAKFPIVMAGNGVIRAKATDALVGFADTLNIPVATTFMAKGAIPSSHKLSLGAVGLQARDYIACGFDRADVIICIGYDMVEYHPWLWHPTKDRKIVHIDASPAEVDEYYIVEVGVIGNIAESLRAIAALAQPHQGHPFDNLRQMIMEEGHEGAEDPGFPLKPQRIIWDLRKALAVDDIVICDVGAHKMWMARMYEAERPNTCIISNGFAAMGIAVPGAIAAKHSFPHRKVVAVTGDAGFLMNSQEIETAMRLKTPIVILIWSDQTYGLIKWKQINRFNRPSHVDFANPDFLLYAQSFGAKGYRIQAAGELLPALKEALEQPTVTLIDCPVDYAENLKLTEKLGKIVCPI